MLCTRNACSLDLVALTSVSTRTLNSDTLQSDWQALCHCSLPRKRSHRGGISVCRLPPYSTKSTFSLPGTTVVSLVVSGRWWSVVWCSYGWVQVSTASRKRDPGQHPSKDAMKIRTDIGRNVSSFQPPLLLHSATSYVIRSRYASRHTKSRFPRL